MKTILFSTPMVREILDGRKTMTRRVIKPQPENAHMLTGYEDGMWCFMCGKGGKNGFFADWEIKIKARFKPGDILWVRETWADVFGKIEYRANYSDSENESRTTRYGHAISKWKPSIHMPRKAARIFLRVTSVRVERLQDMPLFDVWSEGTPQMPGNTDADGAVNQDDFKYLWDSINARRGYSWESNPWVWVIEFEQISREEATE